MPRVGDRMLTMRDVYASDTKDHAVDVFLRCYDFMVDGGLPDDSDTIALVVAAVLRLDLNFGLIEGFDRDHINARHYVAACIALGQYLAVLSESGQDPALEVVAGIVADRLTRAGCQLAGLPYARLNK